MRGVAYGAVAIALLGCTDTSGSRFAYEVKVTVPDSITAVEAAGEAVPFVMPHGVLLSREWPTYDAALASDTIEITFFAGDLRAHVGHVKPGVCVTTPSFACLTTTRESIAIYDVSGGDPVGAYLDFDVGTYVSFSCEGCGGGFAATP